MNRIENTPEAKARFFALYYGQLILFSDGFKLPNILKVGVEENEHLELTPLSQITDEDAIEWYISTRSMHTHDLRSEGYTHNIEVKNDGRWICLRYKGSLVSKRRISSEDLSLKEAMYLIDKGYYVGDGTEIEYNWVKLKES